MNNKLLEIGNLWRPYDSVYSRDNLYKFFFTTSSGATYEIKYDGAQVDAEDIAELFHAGDPDYAKMYPDVSADPLTKGLEWIDKLHAAQKRFPNIILYSLTFALTSLDDNGDTDYDFHVTNKGGRDALEVFATVQKSVGDFLEQCDDIDVLEFSADSDEKSRQKLYNHFAGMLKTHLGWELLQGRGWGCIEYVLLDPECLNE